MTTTADPKRYRSQTTLTMRGADTGLPAGVCGQVEGIAMIYDVIDDRGTTFARGCLDRTIRERVAAGKVKLYVDHGDALNTGWYDTHLHIGAVREMFDAQEPNGQFVCRFRADIFDTEAGRDAHEYLKAVASTSSETGVSIGMLANWKWRQATVQGVRCEQITEVPLREISITGEPSVPGTRVTAVRAELPIGRATDVEEQPGGFSFTATPLGTDDYLKLLDGIVAHVGLDTVRAHVGATVSNADGADSNAGLTPDSNATTEPDSPGVSQTATEAVLPNVASFDERLAFVRANLHRLL